MKHNDLKCRSGDPKPTGGFSTQFDLNEAARSAPGFERLRYSRVQLTRVNYRFFRVVFVAFPGFLVFWSAECAGVEGAVVEFGAVHAASGGGFVEVGP